jgi:phage I-like protein
MTSISITQLYALLSEKVGKETAEKLTIYIEDKIKDEVQTQSGILATKQDLVSVKQDIAAVELRVTEKSAEMIKWMFIFWVGQVLATFGFILLFLKK